MSASGRDPLRLALQKLRKSRLPGLIGALLVVARTVFLTLILGLGILCITAVFCRFILGFGPSLWLLAPTPIVLAAFYAFQFYCLSDSDRCGPGSLYDRLGFDHFGAGRVRGAWRLMRGFAELHGLDRQDLDHLLSDMLAGRPLRRADGRLVSGDVRVALVFAGVLTFVGGVIRLPDELADALTFVKQASPESRSANLAS